MEILITTLFVPLVGALLLIAEWQSRTAFGRTTRAHWRRGLQWCAIALVPVAAGMIWHAVGRIASGLNAGLPRALEGGARGRTAGNGSPSARYGHEEILVVSPDAEQNGLVLLLSLRPGISDVLGRSDALVVG